MSALLARLPLLLLLGAYSAGSLLHADRTPLWCTAVAAATVLWRWAYFRGRMPLPNQLLRIGIAMVLLVGVFASFRTLNGLAAGSALLVVMGAAKLLETRAPRDAVVVATVALILVLAAALDRQGLLRLPLYLITGWMALASIASLGSVAAAHSSRRAFTSAGKAALYAVPLAALCFVLVPRLPGALWAMPGNGRAETGLSEEMSPGSISDLSLSEEIAFRVRFEGAPPPAAQRYWRGPVLHEFDGYTWRRRPGQLARTLEEEMLSPPVRYRVTLEPHGRNYLFALDTLARLDGIRHQRTFDGETLSWRAIGTAVGYEAVSHLQSRTSGELSTLARRLDTRLPQGRNPRSVALAQQLRASVGTDNEFVPRLLEYFRTGGFEYTLTPPLLDFNSIDDLLFRTRLGYCGHFASAYVMMMRAVNIPARVVTGYQGGSWNAMGGYYTVRQSDAHAWAEVWLDGQGWTRVDPTGVVAPERLQRGAIDAPEASRANADTLFGDIAWLRALRDGWEAAGGWWQEQVVNFNRAKQMDLLARFGLDRLDYGGLALLLLAAGGAWTLVVVLLLTRRERRPPRDQLAKLWEKFATMLGRRDIVVAAHDGPDAVRRRAQQQLPEAASDIAAFTTEYSRLRYGGGDPADARALQALQASLSAIARATAARRRRRTAAATPG